MVQVREQTILLRRWRYSSRSWQTTVRSGSILLLAPQFSAPWQWPPSFALTVPPNPPEPEIAAWVPPPQFQNKYSELKKLNSMTIDLNKKDNLADIRLDYHGVKRFKSGTTRGAQRIKFRTSSVTIVAL